MYSVTCDFSPTLRSAWGNAEQQNSFICLCDLFILKSYAGMRLLVHSYCIPVTNSIRTSQTCKLLHIACKVLHYQLQSLVAWYNLVDCGKRQSLWSTEYNGRFSNSIHCVVSKTQIFSSYVESAETLVFTRSDLTRVLQGRITTCNESSNQKMKLTFHS